MNVALDNKMFGASQSLLLLSLLSAPSTFGRPPLAHFYKVGDMWLTEEQVPLMLRAHFGLQEVPALEEGAVNSPGMKNEKFRWPGGVLKYELSPQLSSDQRALIRKTLMRLETKLDYCIRFRDIGVPTMVTLAWVVVVGDNGCSSWVGYLGKSYKLSLSTAGCMN